jgi:hypothetical protein
MRSNLFGLCLAVGAICVGTATNGMAAGGTFTRGCAARDMQIVLMLEVGPISPQSLNEVSPIPSQTLDDEALALIDARMMCFDGQVAEALVLYDRIAQRLLLRY